MSLQVHTISSNTSCYHLEKLPQKENRQSVFGGFQQWKDWFSIIWNITINIHIVKKAKTNDKCDGNDSVIIRMFVQLYFTILSLLNSCHQFLYLFILLGLVVVSWKPSLKPKWVKKKSQVKNMYCWCNNNDSYLRTLIKFTHSKTKSLFKLRLYFGTRTREVLTTFSTWCLHPSFYFLPRNLFTIKLIKPGLASKRSLSVDFASWLPPISLKVSSPLRTKWVNNPPAYHSFSSHPSASCVPSAVPQIYPCPSR